jgi:hypothetical protein
MEFLSYFYDHNFAIFANAPLLNSNYNYVLYFQAQNDDDLFHLLLKHSLLSKIVYSVYYKPVIGYLLSNQNIQEEPHEFMSIEKIVNNLNENGFTAEAGSLLLQSRSTHSVLQTFGQKQNMVVIADYILYYNNLKYFRIYITD